MTDRYPSAVLMSAVLHGAVIGVLMCFAYVVHHQAPEPVKIFELVAGEGDNFGATEAPALGVPGGAANITVPDIPQPAPEPKLEPAPMTAVQAPPEPVLTKAPLPTKAPEAIPDLTKAVKRTAARKEAVLEKKYKAEDAKKAKEEAARMTKAEFDAKNKAKSNPTTSSSAPKVAKIDGEGIAKGVVGGSTANKTGGAGGKALTRDTGNELEAWEAMLKQRLRDNLEKPPGLSDLLTAVAVVRIGADGSLSGARISKPSGSAEFDQAVLDAIAKTRMPARPDGRSESLSIPFRMRDEAN